jgi:hypothetical protein
LQDRGGGKRLPKSALLSRRGGGLFGRQRNQAGWRSLDLDWSGSMGSPCAGALAAISAQSLASRHFRPAHRADLRRTERCLEEKGEDAGDDERQEAPEAGEMSHRTLGTRSDVTLFQHPRRSHLSSSSSRVRREILIVDHHRTRSATIPAHGQPFQTQGASQQLVLLSTPWVTVAILKSTATGPVKPRGSARRFGKDTRGDRRQSRSPEPRSPRRLP